jgi:hypothetical protein
MYYADRKSLSTCTDVVRLLIDEVSFFSVTPARQGEPLKQASCLSGIARVVPFTNQFRYRSSWGKDEIFHILFTFMSGLEIEIGGKRIEGMTETC